MMMADRYPLKRPYFLDTCGLIEFVPPCCNGIHEKWGENIFSPPIHSNYPGYFLPVINNLILCHHHASTYLETRSLVPHLNAKTDFSRGVHWRWELSSSSGWYLESCLPHNGSVLLLYSPVDIIHHHKGLHLLQLHILSYTIGRYIANLRSLRDLRYMHTCGSRHIWFRAVWLWNLYQARHVWASCLFWVHEALL